MKHLESIFLGEMIDRFHSSYCFSLAEASSNERPKDDWIFVSSLLNSAQIPFQRIDEVVLIDATETPIERPKKSKGVTIQEKRSVIR